MPVLIERTAVVVPSEALAAAGPGAASALAGGEVASDGELVVASFRGDGPVRDALVRLACHGIPVVEGGEPGRAAVVDQHGGPALWWPWMELAVVGAPGGGDVLAARLAGGRSREIAVPAGWRHEGSASAAHGASPLRLVDRPLRHLRREPDADVYGDRWTGEEIRVARPAAPARVTVRGPGGTGGEVEAEVAEGDEGVELGLMFRESIAPRGGMLFRFAARRRHGFWMKNTLVPLDILFVGDDGLVVSLAERAEPMRLRQHRAAAPVRVVLEVPGGWCRAHGVGAGARVEADPPA